MISKPELLAPCGSPEALEAAVTSGADAVYFGGTAFNARMNAKNFSDADLREAVKSCHAAGVKAYVTLNTQLYDRELAEALAYAAKIYEAGADAIIAADLGLAVLLKKFIPDVELHASTQAAGHNTAAAVKLAEIGFSRMVCARELSFADLKTLCADSPIEIEMFVHGALCVSGSGQCLMSAVIGGRSGNRGECAQPCRMKYNGGYPISLKDLSLAQHITEIAELNVRSLKIEGRMKSAAYVAGVTRIYRRLIDENRNASTDEVAELGRVFSRSGFTDGYFTGGDSVDAMVGVRTELDINASAQIPYKKDTPYKRVDTIPEVKRTPPILDADAVGLPALKRKNNAPIGKKRVTARFASAAQIPDSVDYFDQIYLPLEVCAASPGYGGVILPAVIKDCEISTVRSLLERCVRNGVKHVMIGNIGHIAVCEGLGLAYHGDFRLNAFNSASLGFYDRTGFVDVILSPELTLPQIRDISGGEKSVIIYGRLPLMTLAKPPLTDKLKDRTNAVFPVAKELHTHIVYNSGVVYMADKRRDLDGAGAANVHFIFTTETKQEAAAVIKAYESGLPPKQGLYFRRIGINRK
jgi:collagenase-like PrtC family protease